MDTFVLDQAAKGGITGSKLTNPMIEEMDSDMQRTRLIPEDYVVRTEEFYIWDLFIHLSELSTYLTHPVPSSAEPGLQEPSSGG